MAVGRKKFGRIVRPAMDSPVTLLSQAINQTNAWAAIIMLPDESRGVLDCVANVGLPKDWENITNALDQTTGNGRCYISGKTVLIEKGPIEQPDGSKTYHYMSAIAVIPIKHNRKVFATLEVVKDTKGSTFTLKEIKKLQTIAEKLSGWSFFRPELNGSNYDANTVS